jgi:hypothetical protein
MEYILYVFARILESTKIGSSCYFGPIKANKAPLEFFIFMQDKQVVES